MSDFARVVRSLAWSAAERLGSALILLVSAFWIARLIGPAAFGAASLALSLVFTFQLAAERFFHEAIVQRPELKDDHIETALVAASASGLALGGLVLLLAKPAAHLFGVADLAVLIPIAAIAIVVAAPGGVVVALLHRRMAYRKLAERNLAGAICGAIAGIACALLGQGALALVLQVVVQAAASSAAAFLALGRIPRFHFSPRRLSELGGFSLSVMVELLVYNGAFRVFIAIVGLTAGVNAVGYVELAYRLANTVANFWSMAINPVVLNIFTAARRSRTALAAAYLRASEINAAAVLPMYAGLAFVADDLLRVSVGPQWTLASGALTTFAVECAIRLSRQFAPQAFYAAGRPTFGLYGAIVGFVAANGLLLFLGPHDPTTIAAIWTARLAFTAALSAWFLWRVTGLSLAAQAATGAEPLFAVATMLAALWCAHTWVFAGFAPVLRLGCEVCLGVAIYAFVLLRLKPSLWSLATDVAKQLRREASGAASGSVSDPS